VLRLCNKSVYKQHSKEDIVEEAWYTVHSTPI
jgi:hypothetical protein